MSVFHGVRGVRRARKPNAILGDCTDLTNEDTGLIQQLLQCPTRSKPSMYQVAKDFVMRKP